MRTGLLFLVLVLFPSFVLAGGHDPLRCVGCHSMHDAKGNMIFAVKPNTSQNPATKKPNAGVSALCLGCHDKSDHGGIGVLPLGMSHPFDVTPNPKVAKVPEPLLRDGKLDCMGCHEPHPSNPNPKYLRVDTSTKDGMEGFCSVCHAGKGKAGGNVKIYGLDNEASVPGAKPIEAKPKAVKK